MKWIMKTSTAQMPQSCPYPYLNVAVLLVTDECLNNGGPKMISTRAKGVLALNHLGYQRAPARKKIEEATALVAKLNAIDALLDPSLLATLDPETLDYGTRAALKEARERGKI